MHIVAWNIRQGGGSRTVPIVDHLLEINPTVIILSEFRNNNSGHFIRAKLLTKGFLFQYGSCEDPKKNGVLIASKIACNFYGYSYAIEAFPEAVISAQFPAFRIWGLYLPHKKKHSLFPFLLNQIQELAEHHVLMGDFNTGINHLDQKGSSFWYSEYLVKFKKQGLVDAFRHQWGKVKEYSWYSHQGNGYRYDHCWISNQLTNVLENCSFDHSVRKNELSDHSLMGLTLDDNWELNK